MLKYPAPLVSPVSRVPSGPPGVSPGPPLCPSVLLVSLGSPVYPPVPVASLGSCSVIAIVYSVARGRFAPSLGVVVPAVRWLCSLAVAHVWLYC